MLKNDNELFAEIVESPLLEQMNKIKIKFVESTQHFESTSCGKKKVLQFDFGASAHSVSPANRKNKKGYKEYSPSSDVSPPKNKQMSTFQKAYINEERKEKKNLKGRSSSIGPLRRQSNSQIERTFNGSKKIPIEGII